MSSALTPEQIDSFHRDGFLVLPDFVSTQTCVALRQRADEILTAFDPQQHRSVFTTDEQSRHADEVFLESANTISCFFEEHAFGPDGRLCVEPALAVNKIGHALHDLDPVFEAFSYQPALADVAEAIGLVDALALQSMYICKQPRIGGEVGCHQDATFLWTDPISVTGFWFALEDATIENGCLWAAPGGHRTPLRKQFRRTSDPDRPTEMIELDPTPLPAAPDDLVPLEVAAGTLVVLHGLLPHWSDVNRSDKSRHAYTLHCISAASEYPAWNWLRRDTSFPLRRLRRVVAA